MKCITIIFYFCLCAVLAEQEIGYYWVDYDGGPIPANALKIWDQGNDYVGQVYTKAYELLPATIRTYAPYANFNAYNKELTSNKNIKVLCSQCNDNFQWIKTNASTYKSLDNLVLGGSELHSPAYFGRYFRNGRAVLGKLGGALALPFEGHEQYVYKNIEVLVHKNCEITPVCLDVRSMDQYPIES